MTVPSSCSSRTVVSISREDWQGHDLERIGRYAHHAMNNAIQITGAVRVLRAQPAFETRAEDQLRCAEAELEAALNAVRGAMREFSTKPVTA